MLLSGMQVKNYRCLKDVELVLGDMTALIGANGSGKSALLRALAAFYEEGDPLAPEDWYSGNTGSELEICLTFSNLNADELETFQRYVTPEGTLRVARVYRLEADRIRSAFHGYHFACPEFAELREADKGVRELHNALADSGRFEGLARVGRAEDSEAALQDWERANPGRCEWIRDGGKFFGWQQVGGSKLRESSICVYVPAVRDARADAAEGRGSVLSRIVDLVIRGELARNPDLVKLREETQARFGDILEGTRPILRDVARDLSVLVSRFSPGAEVRLDWRSTAPALPDWPAIEARLVEDGVDTPVFAKGHGLQRSFIVSLLQRLAELLSKGDLAEDEHPSRHTLLLIEEPELYQHPLAARRFAQVLRELAGAGGAQVVYSTHHRDFVSFDHFDGIRRVAKVARPDEPPVTVVHSLGLEDVRQQLVRLWDLDSNAVTEDSTRQRLRTVMTPEVSEGFFARRVVLVEGEQDRAMLEGCCESLNIDLTALGTAILPVGGKSSLDRALIVFRGFGIPTFMIWDGDRSKGRKEDARQNRVLLELGGLQVEDFPGTQVGTDSAVFEDELESELKAGLGPRFDDLLAQAAELVGLHRGRDLLKTWYGCRCFLEIVRETGCSLGVLDELATRLAIWSSQ